MEIGLDVNVVGERQGRGQGVVVMGWETCVMAVGLRAGNTRVYFCVSWNRSRLGTGRVITVTRSITVMNTISTFMGGHALTSPEGGGPCLLSTFNYGVVGYLAFRLT